MKLKIMPFIYFLTSAHVFAQARELVEVRQIADFNSLSASAAVNVVLQEAQSPSVKIVSEGVELSRVITEVSGGKLRISINSTRKSGGSKHSHVTAYVFYTGLKKIEASSAATVKGTGIKIATLEISASSAAEIDITDIKTNTLILSASSAAELEITGESEKTTIEADSASKVKGENLISKSADILASSAAEVRLTVDKEMTVNASSGATVRYKGDPAKNISEMSSGASIKKM